MRRHLAAFAMLASLLLLAGCAAQPSGGEGKKAQPALQNQTPLPGAQNVTNASAEENELAETKEELDALDAGLEESIADLESLR